MKGFVLPGVFDKPYETSHPGIGIRNYSADGEKRIAESQANVQEAVWALSSTGDLENLASKSKTEASKITARISDAMNAVEAAQYEHAAVLVNEALCVYPSGDELANLGDAEAIRHAGPQVRDALLRAFKGGLEMMGKPLSEGKGSEQTST